MPTFAVLGATGFTGRLVLRELARRGHGATLAGRDRGRLWRAAPDGLALREVVAVDVTVRADLDRLLRDTPADAVLTTVGPFTDLGREVVGAAVEHGLPYVDSAGEQPFLRWIRSEWHAAAVERGVPVVPAAGFDFLPGDLLAALAVGAVEDAQEVHVAYAVPRAGDLLRGWSRGTRRSMVRALTGDGVARVDGRLVQERAGQERRLAWFPRPVGPHHAASIPGGEPLSVVQHAPQVPTVRTYLAVPSLVAEVVQATATALRRPALAAALERLAVVSSDPDDERRSAVRWACVAEARGTDDAVARSWAYGHDVYGLTAAAMVLVGERLAAGAPGGVLAPAQLGDPAALLDELGVRTDLRWSITRP